MVAITSIEAYHEHKRLGKVCRQASDLLEVMADKPRLDGFTRNELSEASGVRLSSVCARVNELLAYGALRALPVRKCRITGRKATPVWLRS